MFGLGSTLPWFCVLWGLNGILQGWGGPACAKIITSWFATKERGTYWGLWNISHNLGAFLAPLLAGTAARALGWRWGVFAPGLIGLSVAGLVYAIVRNSPEDIGRQPAEVAQADDAAAVEVAEAVAEAEQSGGAEMGMVERLRKNVLSQPAVWLLAFTFLFVYLIRQALTSWMVFFLIEKKGVSDFAQASAAAARHACHRTAVSTAAAAAPPPPPPPPPPHRLTRLPTLCAGGGARLGARARRADGLAHRGEAVGQTDCEREAGRGPRRQAAPRGARVPDRRRRRARAAVGAARRVVDAVD